MRKIALLVAVMTDQTDATRKQIVPTIGATKETSGARSLCGGVRNAFVRPCCLVVAAVRRRRRATFTPTSSMGESRRRSNASRTPSASPPKQATSGTSNFCMERFQPYTVTFSISKENNSVLETIDVLFPYTVDEYLAVMVHT